MDPVEKGPKWRAYGGEQGSCSMAPKKHHIRLPNGRRHGPYKGAQPTETRGMAPTVIHTPKRTGMAPTKRHKPQRPGGAGPHEEA